MFDVHCIAHGGRVLLTARRILAIEGVGPTLSVRYRCWCGHEDTWRPHAPAAPVAAGVAAGAFA